MEEEKERKKLQKRDPLVVPFGFSDSFHHDHHYNYYYLYYYYSFYYEEYLLYT